jgi:hypothetical protein
MSVGIECRVVVPLSFTSAKRIAFELNSFGETEWPRLEFFESRWSLRLHEDLISPICAKIKRMLSGPLP